MQFYYIGNVGSSQPQASYHRAKHRVCQHQYYRNQWNMTLMPLFQTMLRNLTKDAIDVSKYMDCLSHKVLTHAIGIKSELSYIGHCNMSILTMANHKVHGFGCSLHKDDNDCYSNDISQCAYNKLHSLDSRNKSENVRKRHQYALQTIETLNLGVKTTCGYHIHIKDGSEICEDNVYAYFFSADLGAAVRIKSNYFHSFHAYAFNHQTVVAVVKHDGFVFYKHPDLDILGWGAGKKKNR